MSEAEKKKKRDYDPSGAMALFIAASLQHPNPECNGNRKRVSTIRVSQHKNKFGHVVVYCTLADDNEVNEAWAEAGNSGLPTEDYRRRCLDDDAIVYRTAYEYMRFLAPQFKELLLPRCDYPSLIFETIEEALDWLDKPTRDGKKIIDGMLESWYATDPEELKKRFVKIYARIY